MKQYWELKSQAGDALLFFRMGDFYELFGDDALEASKLLEITLTSRDKNKANPMPMCGFPHHSSQNYVQKILRLGRKVAIGEQTEEAGQGKTLVKREIVRIFTPGVQFDAEGSETNYLAVIAPVAQAKTPLYSLACLDAATGEALVGVPTPLENVLEELPNLPIAHLLLMGVETARITNPGFLVEELPANYLVEEQAQALLKRHYEVSELSAFFPETAEALALGVLLTYTLRTQKLERLSHLRIPTPLHKPRSLKLGPKSAQHLDLVPTQTQSPQANLFTRINQTRCALGARQLKRWLLSPLNSVPAIQARQEAIKALAEAPGSLESLSSKLAQVYDLERICARVSTGLANPRDTLALGTSLQTLSEMAAGIAKFKPALLAEMTQVLHRSHEALSPLSERIVSAQKEEAPISTRDGGIFKIGFHTELDRLISLSENGQQFLVELEARERKATGISSLKVRYNRVFGYYIEVTQTHLASVPAHYMRKQTMVGAERFFTEELKTFENEILSSSSRQKALETELFSEILSEIRTATAPIMDAARLLGELDSLCALSKLAHDPGWSFPLVNDSMDLHIDGGRHPLLDGGMVPNDIHLSQDPGFNRTSLVITGPNMGGKSTIMRQTALIVILGQMGAPVPAREVRFGLVSSIYTRIGAQDAIARGQSTFMVEMTELAHILHYADERSLIILDEIGRGTSTYDGISVAWATLEWIATQIKARTLFATHYHELTRLVGTLPRLANMHMAVESGAGGKLRFLYKLKEGPTNESFGIHVANLAGLPKPVIKKAWKILEELEKKAAARSEEEAPYVGQMSLFSLAPTPPPETSVPPTPAPLHPVLQELGETDINTLTPIAALNFIAKLQEISRNVSSDSFSG
ncbi:DNA mismatch repair protein MutS [Bdellovibrionota bacterium FG-1]